MVGQEPNPAVTGQKVGPVRTGHQSIPGLIIQCAFCNVVPALITRTDMHTKFHPHMSPLFEININPSSSSQNERKVKGIFDCCFDYKLESTMALHTRTLLSSAFYFIMCVLLVKDSAVCGEGSVKGGGETDEPFYTFVQVEQASGGTGGNICKS